MRAAPGGKKKTYPHFYLHLPLYQFPPKLHISKLLDSLLHSPPCVTVPGCMLTHQISMSTIQETCFAHMEKAREKFFK